MLKIQYKFNLTKKRTFFSEDRLFLKISKRIFCKKKHNTNSQSCSYESNTDNEKKNEYSNF